MANYRAIVERINDAANGWMPDGYEFGYELAHDSRMKPDDPGLDAATPDAAVIDEGCAEMLQRWRVRLQRAADRGEPGASSDLSAMPTTGQVVLVEILHRPTGIRAVKTYAYGTIRDIVTSTTLTNAQKRTQIRNAVGNLLTECQNRVAAAGG